MADILRVQGLQVDDKKKKTAIIKGIDLSLEKSSSIAIIGESGSGKSVSVSAISGLLSPSLEVAAGSIKLRGDELRDMGKRERRSLLVGEFGFVFQDPMSSLNPLYTIEHQICECFFSQPISSSEKTALAKKLIDSVDLDSETTLKKYPHQLSGGQRQRVMIAIAIAGNPSILIADEPTTALDVTVQKNILKLLKSLVNTNEMSMIFISHDLNLVKYIADYIYILYRGYVVESGFCADIFNSPISPYTKGLINCLPENTEKQMRIPTIKRIKLEDAKVVSGEPMDIIESIDCVETLNSLSYLKDIGNRHFVRVYI